MGSNVNCMNHESLNSQNIAMKQLSVIIPTCHLMQPSGVLMYTCFTPHGWPFFLCTQHQIYCWPTKSNTLETSTFPKAARLQVSDNTYIIYYNFYILPRYSFKQKYILHQVTWYHSLHTNYHSTQKKKKKKKKRTWSDQSVMNFILFLDAKHWTTRLMDRLEHDTCWQWLDM